MGRWMGGLRAWGGVALCAALWASPLSATRGEPRAKAARAQVLARLPVSRPARFYFKGDGVDLSERGELMVTSMGQALLDTGVLAVVAVAPEAGDGAAERAAARARVIRAWLAQMGVTPALARVEVAGGDEPGAVVWRAAAGQAPTGPVAVEAALDAPAAAVGVAADPGEADPVASVPLAATGGEPAARLDALLAEANARVTRFADGVSAAAACGQKARAGLAWLRGHDARMDTLGDEVARVIDFELNFQYTPGHRAAFERYRQAVARGVRAFDACDPQAADVAPFAQAMEGASLPTDLERAVPTGFKARPLCRRLWDTYWALDRDRIEGLRGAERSDGTFALSPPLPGYPTCELVRGAVHCEVGAFPDEAAAVARWQAVLAEVRACFPSVKRSSELDRSPLRHTFALRAFGFSSNAVIFVSVLPPDRRGHRVLLLMSRKPL